jgi:Fe2+ or Zn2+ uptake regulation protein
MTETRQTSSLDQTVKRRLDEHEARYTPARRAVVGALSVAEGPRSAAELHGEIGDSVPLSSLYRSLAVLEEAGVIEPHFGAKGLTRYELAEWITGHHHHVICVECGMVEDVEIPDPYEARVRELVEEIAGLVSFSQMGHTLEIEGRCSRCR